MTFSNRRLLYNHELVNNLRLGARVEQKETYNGSLEKLTYVRGILVRTHRQFMEAIK